MSKLGKFICVVSILTVSSSAFADWIRMDLVGNFLQQKGMNDAWIDCTYSTSLFGNGQQITIRVSDYSCPSSIEYNPETNSWRK